MAEKQMEIADFITEWLSQQLGQEVSAEANFGALGLDSLDAVELTDALADKLGREQIDVSLILDYPTAVRLGEHLANSERE
jgi:acyl carrier protein